MGGESFVSGISFTLHAQHFLHCTYHFAPAFLYFRLGNPVLNLNYLLETIAQKVRPLNWTAFWEKQVNNKLPLKVTHCCFIYSLMHRELDLMYSFAGRVAASSDYIHIVSLLFTQSYIFSSLQIVTSGLLTQQSVVLFAKDGNFATMPQLAECLRASMMIPGVAGEVVRLKVRNVYLILFI